MLFFQFKYTVEPRLSGPLWSQRNCQDAGAHRRFIVDEELSRSSLDKVYVGQTKDRLSAVDEQLVIDDVCTVFGQHVKYIVTLSVREDAQSPCSSTTLQNAL